MIQSLFFAVDGKHDFIVYNAAEKLSQAEIFDNDIIEIEITEVQKLRSEAWSCNCRYFFIIIPEGICLLSTFETKSLFCKKKSMKFIEMYVNFKCQKAKKKEKK